MGVVLPPAPTFILFQRPKPKPPPKPKPKRF